MRALENVQFREMPQSIDCEQGLIGCVLLNNDAYRQVSGILKAEDFREDFHRKVWKTIDHMVGGMGKIANPLTVKTVLGDVDIGGVTVGQYLSRMAAEATSTSNAKEYAEILRDLAARRRLIGVCQDTIDEAYDMPVESKVATLIDNFEDNVMALRSHTGDASDFEGFDTVSMRAMDEANEAYTRGPGLVGLSSGFQRIDDALGGLMKTNLIILGGRPGAGKTALSTNIGLSVARELQRRKSEGEKRVGRVGFFSLEMKKEQLARRIFADVSGVPDWKVRRGFATEDEMTRWIDAQRELRTIPFDIDDTSGLTIGQLRIRARNLKKRRGLELLIVDYLQLLSGAKDSGRRETNRTQEITEITTGLKELAKELDIPIIALSQLSRRVEERDDKRPMLSDLRESGSIEQDADQVLFVYRDEYYVSKQKAPMEGTEARAQYDRRMRAVKGIAEIIIGKNRHGPEATIELGFDGSLTKFLNAPEPREPEPEGDAQPKEKNKRLPKEASELYGLLRASALAQYPVRIPTADEMKNDRNLKKTARLLSAIKMRETFAQQVLGADTDPKLVEKRFRETMVILRHAGIAMWSGNKEEPLIWLPELAE